MHVALEGLRLGPDTAPLDATFRPGRLNVLLGDNGAGKTRLCRLIAGLDQAPDGRIRFGDEDVTAVGVRRRPVSMVYQDFVNYPSLTVRDNIGSSLRARGEQPAVRAERVAELAERLAITDQLDKRPDELSGGQQQRVAIARALAKGAPVSLLDEPLANLDLKLREALRADLRQLFRQDDATVIYATSDPFEALEIADAVYLMDGADIIQQGPVLDVYRTPVCRRAADLLSDPGVNDLGDGRVVRPEHVRLDRRADDDLSVAGVVDLVETDGTSTFLHATVLARPWVARLTGLYTLAPGTSVALFVSRANVLAPG